MENGGRRTHDSVISIHPDDASPPPSLRWCHRRRVLGHRQVRLEVLFPPCTPERNRDQPAPEAVGEVRHQRRHGAHDRHLSMATTCRSIRSSSTSPQAIAFGVLYCVVAEYSLHGSRSGRARRSAFLSGSCSTSSSCWPCARCRRRGTSSWAGALLRVLRTYPLDVEHRDRATRSAQPGSAHTSPIRGCRWVLDGRDVVTSAKAPPPAA